MKNKKRAAAADAGTSTAALPNDARKGKQLAVDIITAIHLDLPPLDFVLPGLMAGTVGMLSSPGGVGKSTWALQAAIAVAGGPDLLELGITRTGDVLYLAWEDPDIVICHRLQALRKYMSQRELESVAEKLMIITLGGSPIDLTRESEFINLIQVGTGVRLIIIDTMSRVHRLDENSNGDMGWLIGKIENIAIGTGAAVLLLHHMGKESARVFDDTPHGARGASALTDNARWAATMRAPTAGEARERIPNIRHQCVRWAVCKASYSAKPTARWYVRHEGGVLLPLEKASRYSKDGSYGD